MSVIELLFNHTSYLPVPTKIVLTNNTDIYAYDASVIDGYQTGRKGQSFDCYGVYHELNGGHIKKGYYFLIIHPRSGHLSVVPIDVASPNGGVISLLSHIRRGLQSLFRNEVVA